MLKVLHFVEVKTNERLLLQSWEDLRLQSLFSVALTLHTPPSNHFYVQLIPLTHSYRQNLLHATSLGRPHYSADP